MLPVLILSVPPAVCGGGYFMWHQGAQTVLGKMQEPPKQTFTTYTAGMLVLGGSYVTFYKGFASVFLQDLSIDNYRKDKSSSLSERGKSRTYVPPKTMQEMFERAGKPTFVRIGAGGLAFFLAGVTQTYLALQFNSR